MQYAAEPTSLRRPMNGWVRPVVVLVHRLRFLRLRIRSLGRVTAAAPPTVARGVRVLSPARVSLGRRTSLGRGVYIETDLVAGDDVLLGGGVALVGNVHPIDGPGPVTGPYVGPPGTVRMDGDNFIGEGAIVIAPCHLQHGAIVGAGAVATGTLLADTIYVGVPARPLRRRDRGGGQAAVSSS